MKEPEYISLTKTCHCGHTAHKYRKRDFINQLDVKVTRVFYRCENCWSRITNDYEPEIDKLKYVDAYELLQEYSKNHKIHR